MPKFFIKTYGCQMNERDSEQVAHSLIARGYERVTHETEADVVLLNTCSVRDMADQKALGKMGMLGQIAKHRPEVVFGFLGCMAQARGSELFNGLPHVDLVVGTQKFHRVADYVEEIVARKREVFAATGDSERRRMDDPRFSICDIAEEVGSEETICEQEVGEGQGDRVRFDHAGMQYALHLLHCAADSWWERSRAIAEIVAEVRRLVAQGVKEITLLGQIVNLYGRHEFPAINGKSPFVQLLQAVHEVDGLQRLRFTSPHPIGFREDLIQAFVDLPKLAEHVHLPLQSGSNRILRAMHRPYTSEKYRVLVERLRQARSGIAVTTDVIVGFPSETNDDYRQTRDLVEEMQFDNAFVFRYSTRRNTPAAEMPEQVDEKVKEERNQDLLQIVNASCQRANARLVGQDVEVLCEGPSKTNASRLMGRTRTNKIVIFEGQPELMSTLLDVHVRQARGFSLYGAPVVQPSPPIYA